MTIEMKGYILDRNKEYPVHKGDFLIEVLSKTYNHETKAFEAIPSVSIRLELYPDDSEGGDGSLTPMIYFAIPTDAVLPSSFKDFNETTFSGCEGEGLCSGNHYHFESWYGNDAPFVTTNSLSISYNKESQQYDFSWKGEYTPFASNLSDEEKQSGLYTSLTSIEAHVSVKNIRIWIHVAKVEDTMAELAKAMPYIDTETLVVEKSEVSNLHYYGSDNKDEIAYNVYAIDK